VQQLAIVCRVAKIEKHPNADRLELVTVDYEWGASTVVTGPHYAEGQLGIYIRPGAVIPGYIAEDCWLVGRGGSNAWTPIVTKNMRGIESPGLFCGAFYKKLRGDPRSEERFTLQGEPLDDDWIAWRYWRDHWKVAEDVSAYLGIRAA
jgi:tRNA-binding EMAP/Myf-like protein